MCSLTPLECPLGTSMGYHMISPSQRHHLEGLQTGLRYLQNPEFRPFWTYHQIQDLDHFGHTKIPPVSSYSHLYIQIWTPFGTPFGDPGGPIIPSYHPVVPYVPPILPICPFGISYGCIHRYTICGHHLRWSPGGSPEPSKP